MKAFLPVVAAFVLFGRFGANAADAPPLQPMDALLTAGKLWEMTATEFMTANRPYGFRFTSNAQDSANSTRPGLTLCGLPVYEAVARFQEAKLAEITLLLFNRGDAGNTTREQFEAMLLQASKGLTTVLGAQPVEKGKDAQSAVKAEGLWWGTANAQYLLESSYVREVKTRGLPFRAEFIRLRMSPPAKTGGSLLATSLPPSQMGRTATTGLLAAKSRVQRKPDGDVVIDSVPMVDQGQKGYCAVACAERVMRYYGMQTDEHELAQVANTSAGGGTSPDAMMGALKKLSNRLRIRVRTQIDPTDIREFQQMIADYNRAAKRRKAREINLPTSGVIDLGKVYQAMDNEVLAEARSKRQSDFGKFEREVQQHIDQGVPVLWSVVLGMVKEPEIPQAFGGHMRLIVGYNSKSKEILYTDSWGKGHEMKRMTLANAWTMTNGLFTIEPL